jgi:DME family drug/metabolite transporter
MRAMAESRPRVAQVGPPLAVLGAAVLFGTTGTSQALGPAATTAVGVGAVRLAFGAATLAAIALARRPAKGRAWRQHLIYLLLGGAAVAAYQLCWFAGLRRTGVALGTVVGIGSGPVFAGIFHLAAGRTVSRSWVVATAATVAGATLLAFRGPGAVFVDPVGLCFMAGAGFSYAAYTVSAKQVMGRGLDAAGALAAMFGLGAVLMAPLLAFEPLAWLQSVRGATMALHLGIVTIGVAYWLYGWGLSYLSVPTVVTLTLAEPLTAALLGVVVLGERIGPLGVIGSVVIAIGIVIAGRAQQQK